MLKKIMMYSIVLLSTGLMANNCDYINSKKNVNELNSKDSHCVTKIIVEQMAQGVRKLLKTDFAIATSGIAGPTGGTTEKPVGTVWISACSEDGCITREFHFGVERERNIERASQAALLLLKEII